MGKYANSIMQPQRELHLPGECQLANIKSHLGQTFDEIRW